MVNLDNRIDVLHLPKKPLDSSNLHVNVQEEIAPSPLEEHFTREYWNAHKLPETRENNRLFLEYAQNNSIGLLPGKYSTFFVADQLLKKAELSPKFAQSLLDSNVAVLGVAMVYKTADNGIVILKKKPGVNYQGKDAYVIITGGVPYDENERVNLFKTVGSHAGQVGLLPEFLQEKVRYIGMVRDTGDGANPTATFSLESHLTAAEARDIFAQSTQQKYGAIEFLSADRNDLLKTMAGNYTGMNGQSISGRMQRVHLGGILVAGYRWFGDDWFDEAQAQLLTHPDRPVDEIIVRKKFG